MSGRYLSYLSLNMDLPRIIEIVLILYLIFIYKYEFLFPLVITREQLGLFWQLF